MKLFVLQVLSPQQMVSCAENPEHCGGTGGCDGSTPELAMDYTIQNLGLNKVFTRMLVLGCPVVSFVKNWCLIEVEGSGGSVRPPVL